MILSAGPAAESLFLVVDSPTREDQGRYHCRVTFTDGTTRDAFAGFLVIYGINMNL